MKENAQSKNCIFLKESSRLESQLKQLQAIERKNLPEYLRTSLDEEIITLKKGIEGEEKVKLELLRSRIPMFVIQDLQITDGELTDQIDFLVVTQHITIIIECKYWSGNIKINSNGDFIQIFSSGSSKREECVFSPVTQNQSHMEAIKKTFVELKPNAFLKHFAKKWFTNYFASLIVLSNDKAILDDSEAPDEIKSVVIKHDRLTKRIKELIEDMKKNAPKISDGEMRRNAERFLKLHKEREEHYAKKYLDATTIKCALCGEEMVTRKSKKGEKFLGCKNYSVTECKYTLSIEVTNLYF